MASKLNKSEQAQGRIFDLLRIATEACEKAYAPYSKFKVGAAVLTADGKIFGGANIENVSYGLTVCAERVAVMSAVAAGEREIVAVAIVTEGGIYPCGACLQVIQEFAGEEPPVIITASLDDSMTVKSLSECLPCAFTKF